MALDLVGPLTVSQDTRDALIHYARLGGELRFEQRGRGACRASASSELLQLIVATREVRQLKLARRTLAQTHA